MWSIVLAAVIAVLLTYLMMNWTNIISQLRHSLPPEEVHTLNTKLNEKELKLKENELKLKEMEMKLKEIEEVKLKKMEEVKLKEMEDIKLKEIEVKFKEMEEVKLKEMAEKLKEIEEVKLKEKNVKFNETEVTEEVDTYLNLLLMGKTGQGKSATGNFLLKRKNLFRVSAKTTSQTKKVEHGFAQFGRYLLLVVDGPGLEDTDMNKSEDTTAAAKHMDIALAKCYGGVDAFLFVTKFGNRFTAEDRSTLEALKGIFGGSYLNHVVVVVTGGDLFHYAMKEENLNISFHEWCKEQTGEFRQLYDDCKGRFVLFNNREEDEKKMRAQKQEIFQLAKALSYQHGRYTSQCFKDAEREREKLILEEKAPQLTREIQEKIGLLAADIEQLSTQPTGKEKKIILARIKALKKEIKVQDQGFDVLGGLKKQVEDLEKNLDNVEELQKLTKQIEAKENESGIWNKIKEVCIFVFDKIRRKK